MGACLLTKNIPKLVGAISPLSVHGAFSKQRSWLAAFALERMRDIPALAGHFACILLALEINDIYALQDGSVKHVDRLARLSSQYFDVFMAVYPECAVPKIHYSLHIPDIIRKKGYYLTTFACERKHKHVKKYAEYCKSPFSERLLMRCVRLS